MILCASEIHKPSKIFLIVYIYTHLHARTYTRLQTHTQMHTLYAYSHTYILIHIWQTECGDCSSLFVTDYRY